MVSRAFRSFCEGKIPGLARLAAEETENRNAPSGAAYRNCKAFFPLL